MHLTFACPHAQHKRSASGVCHTQPVPHASHICLPTLTGQLVREPAYVHAEITCMECPVNGLCTCMFAAGFLVEWGVGWGGAVGWGGGGWGGGAGGGEGESAMSETVKF